MLDPSAVLPVIRGDPAGAIHDIRSEGEEIDDFRGEIEPHVACGFFATLDDKSGVNIWPSFTNMRRELRQT